MNPPSPFQAIDDPQHIETIESPTHATAYDASAAALWGELFGPDQLAAHARDLAARHQRLPAPRNDLATPKRSTWDSILSSRRLPLLRRLNETETTIGAVRDRLLVAVKKGADVSPAGAWLLDNYFVVLEHAREIRATMSRAFYRRLPKLGGGPHAGLPRAYDIAIELVAHTDGRLDSETITRMLSEYQRVAPLTLAELWAMPAMLRMSLLENIRRMALRADRDMTDAAAADRWVTRLRAQHGTELAATLSAFVRQPPDLTPAFLARFLQQLRANQADFTPLLWLEQWIADEGMSPDDAMRRSTQRLSLTQLIMANSITSLRMVAGFDWAPFVESMSVTDAVLRQDPAGVYGSMTFETRDQYRHVVEEVAAHAGRSEPEVAEAVVALAQHVDTSGDADRRRSHVGYYLIAAGRPELEHAVSYLPSPGERGILWVYRKPGLAYFGTLIVLSVIALALLLGPLPGNAGIGVWLLAFALIAIPATETALAFLNHLVTLSVPPHRMARLDYRAGVPPADRALVVVPLLVPSCHAVVADLERLETQYLANRDREIRFALLGDFLDADRESMPDDEAIMSAAVETVRTLNAKYAKQGERGPFYYFHRPRRWNGGERTWMGWERKRGKLADLNAFLRGGHRDAFSMIEGDLAWVRHVHFVITLDADTTLPAGAAARLIGAMAHPLNRPVVDPETNRVVRGYGIMQPRVSVSLESANRSRFAAIFSGHPGVDPYTTAVSDVYQDLFGEGTFTGKGIYDVEVFERATAGRFPENTLLSHDLIEGAFARAGLVTDVEVFDDYPTQYLAAARRQHRWMRGDWQLLRWLTSSVPGITADGTRETANPLSTLSRWKIADNLRRSMLPIATFLWLIAAWTVLPGNPVEWTLAVLATMLFPLAFGLLLDAINPPRREAPRSWQPFYSALWQDSENAAKQFGLRLVFLPHQAQISADAILRTLWRLFVSKRHLLEWLTASQAEHASSRTSRELWRHLGPAAIVGGLIALKIGFGNAPLLLTIPFAAVWIASPEIARLLAQARQASLPLLSQADRNTALRYARIHWSYFERYVGDSTGWLAPDNVQETPRETVALRTSPTNIGLQLLSTVTAHELGFITRTEMLDRLERAFATLERMTRYRGHWYNWYGLPNLAVLDPPYISTVDSGNFAGHLIALAQGLRAIADATESHSPRGVSDARQLHGLADRARAFAMSMDFSLVYDSQRKLFSIGYDERAARLDPSSYDLLASESRLTSFFAIAKGDVPVEHWFHLGRTLTIEKGATALVSWSGSMFEYLMPVLVMPSRTSSLLDQTHRAATRRQEIYGKARGVPWGISESAYNLRDRHGTYQYRAFGVPDLALMRGLVSDLVVAPYATMLALLVDPVASFANLKALEAAGALGPHGFYDAIDFTRHTPTEPMAIVRTCMAHHIGMSLIALHDTLDVEGTESVWQRRFMSEPIAQAAALLLDERVPRHFLAAPAQSDKVETEPEPVRVAAAEPVVREYSTAMTAEPRIALLGTTPYSVLVTNAGAGYSRAGGMAVNRWRADATRDDTGQWIYLSDVTTGHAWSATHQPTAVL
ncbi:MAG: glucoamylase family protein, partial [Gemmatimonadaceae bacterium]